MEWEYIKEYDVYLLDTPIGNLSIYKVTSSDGYRYTVWFRGGFIDTYSNVDHAKEYCTKYLYLKLEELKNFLKLQK